MGASPEVRRVSARLRAAGMGALLLMGIAACGDDGTTPPGALRFGQIGKIEVEMAAPIGAGDGFLEQRLTWGSTGEWSLQEDITYGELVGDERFERNLVNLEQSQIQYAEAITHLNDNPGESLFIEDLPSSLEPDCSGLTSISFTIHDEAKAEDRTWLRCAEGSLGNVVASSAGPDLAAARIVQAVQTVRRATVGDPFRSPYAGSLPFGTIDRGESSGSDLTSPTVFTSFDPWQTFWTQHAGLRPIPYVDFDSSVVVVAMVGPREEAGDSVEVRRILQVEGGTIIEYVERVPGDFCSPAGRMHTPYHIVVTPRAEAPAPFLFGELPREEISCGS